MLTLSKQTLVFRKSVFSDFFGKILKVVMKIKKCSSKGHGRVDEFYFAKSARML